MFAVDNRTLANLEPTVRRVIVADPNMASARLLVDLMKGLGAREILIEVDDARILTLASEFEPGLILTERIGPRLNGENLTRMLRRSTLACRQAPVIMVTADATASTIKGARDAGVHEFLRKPFTAADLARRVETVATRPRGWVEGVSYVGPDRRRFNSGDYVGEFKRKNDEPTGRAKIVAAKGQAFRILAAALAQFDDDPTQAVRAARKQAEILKAVALKERDAALAVAATTLEGALATGVSKASLAGPIGGLLALADPVTLARAG